MTDPARPGAASPRGQARAARIRSALLAGLPPGEQPGAALLHEIAARITADSGCVPLKAHRLARGWTVDQAVDEFHRMCAAAGLRPRGLTRRSWLEWEAGGRPGPDYQDLLSRLLAANPIQLGWAPDYSPPGPADDPAPGAPAAEGVPPAAGTPAAGGGPVPRQLPGRARRFVGRGAELAALDAQLAEASGAAGVVVITAITGTAGIGKTALAVHWAHQVASQFPDGQLYVNLRGFDPSGDPLAPGDALRGFLVALGVPAESIPADPQAQAGLYRSLLAGRRMLVLADNAAGEDQVRPLLPGSSGSLVVVTSRYQLTGLITDGAASPLTLDVLSAAEAGELLASRVGAARAAAEPGAVAELADLCARLPLSLSVTAARAAIRPGLTLAGLAAELRGARDRLAALATGDPATSLRAVLSWSYDHLDPAAARMFRLLGLHPGPDWTAAAAASMAGTGTDEAAGLLARLARAHLIAERQPGRYTFHDLLRAYAAGQSRDTDAAADRHAALTRLLDYYGAAAEAAVDMFMPAESQQRPRTRRAAPATVPAASPAAARAWLDTERPNLVAAVTQAAAGWPGHAIQLGDILFRYLDMGRHYSDAQAVHAHALEAARDAGDRGAQARAMSDLACLDHRLDRLERARERLEAAQALFSEAGDQRGSARVLNNLGVVAWRQGRYGEALGYHQEALPIFHALGDAFGHARTLDNIGETLWWLGRCPEAIGYHQQSLELCRETGDRYGEARSLDNLGRSLRRLLRYPEAAEHHQQARELFRAVGSRAGQADSIHGLAAISLLQGQPEQAAAGQEQALSLYRQAGDRRGEVAALTGAGDAQAAAGRLAEAVASYQAARSIAASIGDRYLEAGAQDGLAGTCLAAGDPDEAARLWRAALAGYAGLGVPEADEVRARLAGLGQAS